MDNHSRMMKVDHIFRLLESEQGHMEWYPRRDPLSELVYTVLSQHTSDVNSLRAYQTLINVFNTWDQVGSSDVDVIVEAIWVGGLARVKAQRIKEVICVIKARRGNLDLNFLADMPLAEAKSWLRELPGVGPKTAAVVLCFSLGMPSMPVDTHIYRVSRRLGLVDIGVSVDEAHDVLEAQIYPERVFPLHMYMINHGRQVCKARRPNCAVCILNRICPSAFSV
tara:strand:+ start:189 stop:857 length:669 start_codon:yes stop_codon:yes gene_type:complete